MCIKSLISSEVAGAAYDEAFRVFFQIICKKFLSRRDFLLKECVPIDLKKLLKFSAISVGSVLSSAIMEDTNLSVFSGRYCLMYTSTLPYCFGNFFILLKMMLTISLFLPYT